MADGPAYVTDRPATTGDSRGGVSAVLVEATPGRSDRILSSVLDSVMVVAESDDGTRSECGLLREAGSVLHVCADFAGGFAAVGFHITVLSHLGGGLLGRSVWLQQVSQWVGLRAPPMGARSIIIGYSRRGFPMSP